MPKIVIEGSKRLSGEVVISGAKNSVVALIPASLLCDEEVIINNVPNISDVFALVSILDYLGVKVELNGDSIVINSKGIVNKSIPCELSSRLRASYYFMGSLLGRLGSVEICFPGGCSIGKRPINLHLKGFTSLGAFVIDDGDSISIEASNLVGNEIFLDFPSVGATINIILASVKAVGKTVINNAAMEPHVVDVCNFLNSMGARISGIGSGRIEICGVSYLHSTSYSVVPDMIEAGTYVVIASLLGNDLKVSHIDPRHIESLINKLEEAGVVFEIGDDYVRVLDVLRYKGISIKTMAYPGFPTDLQQIMVPFMVSCEGVSHIEETIYENRFMNIPDTVKMGASIEVSDNRYATIYGASKLVGKEVRATDLRGGASMIICGLIASGKTVIDDVHYILRGYDDIIGKLKGIGASIELVNDD